MELVFVNWGRGYNYGSCEKHSFSEPISYHRICQVLEKQLLGTDALDVWHLGWVEGSPFLLQACFKGLSGCTITELKSSLDFVEDIFDEYTDEKTLEILAQAANQLGIPFDEFIWRKWKLVLSKTDKKALVEEIQSWDDAWARKYAEKEPTLCEIQNYLAAHPQKVVEAGEFYVLLV